MKYFLILISSVLLCAPAYAGPTRILDGAQITNGSATLTLPTTTTTIIGTDTTNTLSNKTLSGGSNTFTNIPAATALTGVLPIANGGTGASTQSDAANAVLPSQTGQNGKYLSTDGSVASWQTVPATAPNVTGSRASPTAVTAVGGVSFASTAYGNFAFISGSGGPVDISANPQIAAGSNVGQRLVLIGRDATNTVKLDDGTGLSLNGSAVLGLDSVITLVWDGTNWTEESRR